MILHYFCPERVSFKHAKTLGKKCSILANTYPSHLLLILLNIFHPGQRKIIILCCLQDRTMFTTRSVQNALKKITIFDKKSLCDSRNYLKYFKAFFAKFYSSKFNIYRNKIHQFYKQIFFKSSQKVFLSKLVFFWGKSVDRTRNIISLIQLASYYFSLFNLEYF